MQINIMNNDQDWVGMIRSRLYNLGKTQGDLSKKVGTSRTRLSQWLTCHRKIFLEDVRKVENALMQWELEYVRVKA